MKIKIYYRPHVLLAAEILSMQLTKLGHEPELVDHVDTSDKCLHILYCAFTLTNLPKNYIVFQTEVQGSHWFDDHYMRILYNAKAIWDYNVSNLSQYTHLREKCSLVTPGIYAYEKTSRSSGLIFYGALNGRRRLFISAVRQSHEVTVIENSYGGNLRQSLLLAKVVINMHYYPNAPLEIFRVNEALSFGCHVISETGAGMERYREQVYFCEQPAEFRAAIDKALSRDFNYDLSGLDNFEEVKKAIEKVIL